MIRNESEYRESKKRLVEADQRLSEQRGHLDATGLTGEEISRVVEPVESFYMQMREEVASYERLKQGEFAEFENFQGIGQLLIALRIAQGMPQRELARRLEVHESQVSRDERNEYYGITMERATKVLDALGARLKTKVESSPVT